jgi:hypothetical protein
MSSLLTARDMNDDDSANDPTRWVAIGKDNKRIVFRLVQPLRMPLAGSYN